MIVESPLFTRQAAAVWTDEERIEFCAWIAANPEAGDVIPGGEGARKVRWAASGQGKRGGARVIYFNLADNGTVYLVMIYTKSAKANATAREIRHAKH